MPAPRPPDTDAARQARARAKRKARAETVRALLLRITKAQNLEQAQRLAHRALSEA